MAEGVYSQLATTNKLREAERKQQVEINKQIREQEHLKEERENAGFFERLGYSILDFFTELGGGLGKLVEGVVDFGATLIGGTAWAKDFIEKDWTQELWYSWEDPLTNKSYLNDAPIVKDIVRGVGQQLPTIGAIALAPVTGGASLAAVPYTLGATIASAGGGGAEEALQEGANSGQAVLYGVLQSGIEGLVEFASAGLGKGITTIGKAMGKNATKSIGKVILEEGLSEAFEEGISALVNPLTKATYQGSEALESYRDMTFYLDAAQQALVGGIVGAVTASAGAVTRVRSAGGKVNYNINESLQEIQTLDTKADNLFNSNRLTQNNLNEINNQRIAELDNISKQLQSMSQEERKTTIEKFNLSSMFNENGEVIAENSVIDTNVAEDGQILDDTHKTSKKPLISDNIEAYSPSLRNTELVFAPTKSQLTQAAREAKRFIGSLNPNAKIVITDSMFENANAFYDTNSKIFYFTNNTTTQEIVGHEFTHSLDGTKEYKALADYILSNTENLDEKLARKIEQYKDVNTELKQGESGEKVALYEAQTELVSEEMGRILSNQASVERIINQNKGIAYRVWQWIKDAVAKVTKRGKTGEMYNYLRKVENLYAKAIQKSVGGISLSQVAAIEEFERQGKEAEQTLDAVGLDKSFEARYNKYQHQDLSTITKNSYEHHAWATNEITGVLTSEEIAGLNAAVGELRNGGSFNQTASGDYIFEVGDYKSGERTTLVISDGKFSGQSIEAVIKIYADDAETIKTIKEFLYERLSTNKTYNYERLESAFGTYEGINSKEGFRVFTLENRGTYGEFSKQRRNGRLAVKTNSEQDGRGSTESVSDNVGNKRYSLKDSDGNELSEEQVKFFKDSKVRNENGNLLVVYHGSKANITEFSSEFVSNWNALGDGYYFTNDKSRASRYAKQKLLEVYLNIENPLYVNNENQLNKLYKELNLTQEQVLDYAEQQELSGSKLFMLNYYADENNLDLAKVIRKLGFDGIVNDETGEYVAYLSNQIKEITNTNPSTSNDIRYSLKDGEGDYNYSKGQIAKYVAEHSKVKAYTKADAEQIVNTVVSNQLSFGEKYGVISGKTKEQVIDTLWHALNTKDEGYRAGAALDIADYIIDNAVMGNIYESSSNDADMFVVNTLRQYLHNVDLDGIRSEIKYHYDDNNSPYLLWGKRKGARGSGSPDTIARELAELGIRFKSNVPADIFIEMDEMYRNAVKNLKKVAKTKLNSVVNAEDLQILRQEIASELLQGFDETGHKTRFAETIEKYTNKISELKQAVRDLKAYNLAKNNAISTIERLRDEFLKSKPVGWKIPQQVADFVKKIAKVETWRNNISETARQYLKELQFQIDNVLDQTQQQIYPFRETLKDLASGEGELTTEELRTLDVVLRQFAWQLRNYDNVVFEGKSQSNTELATQGVNESRQAQGILRNGSNLLIKFKNKIYANPYDRLAQIGLYRKNSITMRLYADMLEGDRKRANFVKEANDLFADFNKAHKNYLNELQSQMTIGDGDNKLTLTKRQALSLYATSLREQGRSHLFNITDSEGVIRLLDNKYSTRGNMAEAFARGQDVRITKSMINDIKQQLTATDNEYMDLIKQFFNKNSKDAKKVTDQQLYGITNIEDDYYFPIKVSNDKIYTEAGQNNNNVNQYVLEMGMNKSIKPNAQNKIVIDGIDNVLANHIQNMSLYYGFAIPLTAYNRIMNKQVLSDAGQDTTSNMRAEIQKIDVDFEKYMNKLWQDVQGITSGEKGFLSSLMSKIRWAGANSALGANPKVLVTQTLSLAAGVAEFNPKYIAKGMTHFFGETQKAELAKYSSLMWERMEIGNSVDVADIRQVGKEIGNKLGKTAAKVTQALNTFTTKPISWMDSNVIQSLWFAAQYEVADTKGKGFEFGTEANKIEAGKRLDEVVFRTQQTSDALGRSEWMRSQNEFIKFVRMFTGDAVQLTGRLISSVDKYNMARKMIKSGNAELVQQGQTMLNEAKVGVAKSGSAFLLNQAMLLAIAMAFKWIKGKNDDEEWSDIAKNEALANLVGLLPLGGDIYDKLLGYEPTNMAYTALSNLIDIGIDMYEGSKAIISGDYVDSIKRNAAIRKSILNISRLTGVPLQNLESYIKGIVGKISPATREQYNALFKTKTNTVYLQKIRKATENGDEALADAIINIMFDSKTGKIRDDKVLSVTRDLIEKGYDVLPKNINRTISYEGVQYTLTNRQYQQFKKVYSQATDAVKSMVNNVSFKRLDDEAKAKAMTFVYDYYYDLALEDMLGVDLQEKNLLFAQAIPIEMLAMAVAQARLYESDKDKSGNSILGSKKAKIQVFVQSLRLTATQKYMIMGYLGYTNKLGASLVRSYIQGLKLTKEQKTQLYVWSGYSAA